MPKLTTQTSKIERFNKDVAYIKGLIIFSQVLSLNDLNDKSEEKLEEAKQLTFLIGCNSVDLFGCDKPIPRILENCGLDDEWEKGLNEAFIAKVIGPNISLCEA